MNKYFNSFKAIDDLSFELDGGKIYGIMDLMVLVNNDNVIIDGTYFS